MREPTFDEMVEGIRKAISDELSLMRHARYERKPENAWPHAFQKAVEVFLEKHRDEVLANVINKKQKGA